MKKLFCLLLVTCVFYQTCFAWSFFNWNWKPPVVKDNTAVRIKKLEKDVTGAKKIIGDLDLRVSAIDSKFSGIDDEIVKIGQDMAKIDQKTTALIQQISALPTAEIMESADVVPLTIGGKYIGTINKYEFESIDFCGPGDNYQNTYRISCLTVNINGFKPVKIRIDGTLDILGSMVFFDQPNCEGNIYIMSSMVEGSKMGLPLLDGGLSDVNGELYYYSKNSQVMKNTYENYKSFIRYSPDETNNYDGGSEDIKAGYQYTGHGRCWNYNWVSTKENASDYVFYAYKLLQNDPAVTGIDEYPFKGEFLINGRPIIDLSQVPMAGTE